MWNVVAGFTVVWVIIGVGYILGKFQVLGPDARIVLSRLAFFVASPCLLFTAISTSDIADVLGAPLLVAISSAVLTLVASLAFGKLLIRSPRYRSERVVAAQSASQVNAANLGFPIAAYVLGDVTLAAPVVMFQLALWMPVMVASLDQLTASEGRGATRVRGRRGTVIVRRVAQTLGNPIVMGAILGLLFSWQGWTLAGPIGESVDLLAGAAIPALLLSFGLSMVGNRPLAKATARRADTVLAVVLKLLVHPVLAFLIAEFVFGLSGMVLYAAVVMAALPTAQNVLITAVRYDAGETVARDTVLLTTILGIPTLVVVALLLA